MNNYVIYSTATGRIVSVVSSNANMSAAQLDAGRAVLAIPDGTTVGNRTHQVASPGTDNAALVPFVATLPENQAAKIISAVQHFSSLFIPPAGFTWSNVLYQIDSASQSNIAAMGSLATASLANPSTVPWPAGFYWIAADNTHNAMPAVQMLAFAAAVAGYVSTCVLRLRAIKDAIAACTTQGQLDAIDVTAGYPSASA